MKPSGNSVNAWGTPPVLLAVAAMMLWQGVCAGSNVWQTSFDTPKPGALPKGWKLTGTSRGVPVASFTVVTNAAGSNILHMSAVKASAGIMCELKKMNLKKAPIMRWRWRALELPTGADGRAEGKGDQPIHIYVISGSLMAQRCVSYTWETETPRAATQSFSLFMGVFEDTWWCIRNKEDGTNVWFTEERDVAADFRKCYGFVPESVAVMIFCKADQTKTQSAAELEWLAFATEASATNAPPATGK